MTTRTPVRSFLLALALALASCFAVTQIQVARAQALTDAMPTDPQITIGKFANGIRYYIRANKKPEKRAELRLVIKAGSILEDDDQQGMAHLVEHMAFNGTKNFPKNKTIEFMESLGMRFGADVNAYTSFDETVYMLTVPTDKPEMMDKAMLILEDWAHNLSFDAAETEKERGVVMEEWRLGQGANMALIDAWVLAHCVRMASTPAGVAWNDAFARWSDERRPHLRFYQRSSVALTPLFQSHGRIAPLLRDLFFGLPGQWSWVHRHSVAALAGLKTGWLSGRIDLARYDPPAAGAAT